MPQPAIPIHERLRAMRTERGLSQPALFKLIDGVSFETLRGLEAPPGNSKHRYPSPRVLAAVAAALGEPPDVFPEYRLALARQQLDEREVGLDQALATLTRFETALQTAEPVAPLEAKRASASRRRAQVGEP